MMQFEGNMNNNKLLTATRHVAEDVFYQAELQRSHIGYTWAISIGTPDHMVTFGGDAMTPLRALSTMRNTLLSLTDAGQDLLIDVKTSIDILTEESNRGIDPDLLN